MNDGFPWKARSGMSICAETGLEILGVLDKMSTPFFHRANIGDKIALIDRNYLFNVATFAPKIDPKYIYTYDYQPNQSWTCYNGDMNDQAYRSKDYVFTESVYFRLCLKRADGGSINSNEAENLNRIIEFRKLLPEVPDRKKPWLDEEAERVAKRAALLRKDGTLVFALLTDSHYVVNGTWEDTVCSIRSVHSLLGFDGIIHLGDVTDGMVTGEVTRCYIDKVLGSLKKCGSPVHVALGNHDCNYFKDNSERFTLEEQCLLYLGRNEPRYYIDFAARKLRFIFLDSFDPDKNIRYGYSHECVTWLSTTLKKTQNDWNIIVFSHLPPVSRLQYWAKEIRGEEEITGLLNAHEENILAWINGHNHADMIYNGWSFPVISLANAKLEEFDEYKTDGFITPKRKLGDVSQECWNVLLVTPNERRLNLIRFGAGKDMSVKL